MIEKYDHTKVEAKWQQRWEKSQQWYVVDGRVTDPAYILDMFPYPSAEGLHVGHPEGYTASDIYSRYLRAKGKTVLHPMGFDSFGLPAENYAIKTGIHPAKTTAKNITNMRRQIKQLGFSYDWQREVITSDPKYYKWTQWIFVQLFKHGLAYEAEAPINWCPKDKTGLANEEVIDGKCERCGTAVTKKNIKQWLVKITDEKYIERLLNDLDGLDWPDSIKHSQRNWIGKSEGAEVDFAIDGSDEKITVFTTRPDTLFGATYIVLSPEHSLVDMITTDDQHQEVEKHQKAAAAKSDLERTDLAKDKTGVFTGAYAINPVNKQKIPIWIADYVLSSYGTGAIMAVPAHDERDYAFATKFKLPIVKVNNGMTLQIIGDTKENARLITLCDDFLFKERPVEYYEARRLNSNEWYHSFVFMSDEDEEYYLMKLHKHELKWRVAPFTKEHKKVRVKNSGKYNDLSIVEFKKKITTWLKKNKKGVKATNYKLRDWLFSRQRYWGEPIPIIHCDECGQVAVPEKDLPVELPDVKKYEPTGTGESPLASIDEWVNTKCPECGGKAKRETNTMPQWAGSNWYFIRYCDPHNDKQLADPEKLKQWLPVDTYVGGAEHAVLHLLYARFIYKFLFDIGAVPKEVGDEPFNVLKNQGLIMGEDGVKMSKSRGNVINPDDIIKEHGADTMRMYEMFMGPFEDSKPWDTKGIIGIKRFLDKVWFYVNYLIDEPFKDPNNFAATKPEIEVALNKTIKKVGEDIEQFKFNTAISQLMIFMNTVVRGDINGAASWNDVEPHEVNKFLITLAPFAPHIVEELWEKLGHTTSIAEESWPEYNEDALKQETIEFIIQINGKLRDRITAATDSGEVEVLALALARPKIKKYVPGKPKKVIFVPGKLLNLVV